MKKTIILMMAFAAMITAQAQWVNDPMNNTFIANTDADAGEIYLSTDAVSGDTYMQWTQFGTNGWSPSLQRLNFEGVPQWGDDGIHIAGQNFASWSQGIAMTATNDGGVVSCFSNESEQCIAVRINADGTFPWGEAGVVLFDGHGGSRTEVMAGDDGGVWALGSDNTNTYLQYVNPDGSLNQCITISDFQGKQCVFGLMVPANNNGVFVVYEKETWAYTYFYEKEIWVRGYHADGTVLSNDTQLMSAQTIGGSYVHYVMPDGEGGGYAYIWHPAISGSFNTYVFHFNANGASTIMNLNGIPVHTEDASLFHLEADATVDPDSHDLIIAYRQTDAEYQVYNKIFVNRITQTGEKVWDEGILVCDNGTSPVGDIRADAFEYEKGFSVIYHKGLSQYNYQSVIEAKGFDNTGSALWTTEMCSSTYNKTGDQNSTGFHLGQNIIAWINSSTGGLYAQNIGTNGSMGPVTPPTPPDPCDPPTDFIGFYSYDGQCNWYGAELMWTAPETTPLYYQLFRENLGTSTTETIEIEASATEYIDNVGIGDYTYRLIAVYENCESEYALTPEGENYVFIEVTAVDENTDETIVTITKVYTTQGQWIKNANLENLSHGIYIVQGLTTSGKLVNRKVIVN